MRNILVLIIFMSLAACGLNSRTDNLSLSGTSDIIESDSLSGKVVGNVTITGAECTVISYSLEDDKNGYFEVSDEGKIFLAKDNPPVGIYNLIVTAICDDQSEKTNIQVRVTAPIVTIPTTPWVTQLGVSTLGFAGGNNANQDLCLSVKADTSGNVYCAGNTFSSLGEANGGADDAFVMKLDPDGNILWITQLGATTTGFIGGNNSRNDKCNGVDVDSMGNVYCAGVTAGSLGEANSGGFNEDAFVMKLDTNGNLLWVRQLGAVTLGFPGGNNSAYDSCNGVSVDSSGNVYCAGNTSGALGEASGGLSDAFVMKLDSAGNILWVRQLGAVTLGFAGGNNSTNDACSGVSVDSSGNVFCAGNTAGALGEANGGSLDAFVMKLDSSGNILWVRQLGAVTLGFAGGNNSQNDYCRGISVDLNGNSYCGGGTRGSLGEASSGGFNDDAFVMKLNPSGNIVWVRQLGAVTLGFAGGNNSTSDLCLGVYADGSGNVYCSGYTSGALGEAYGGGLDAFVMKINSSGSLLWARQLGAVTLGFVGGDNSAYDSCWGVSSDTAGNVYCAGHTAGAIGEANAGNYDAFIMKLDINGNL